MRSIIARQASSLPTKYTEDINQICLEPKKPSNFDEFKLNIPLEWKPTNRTNTENDDNHFYECIYN